MKTTEKSSNGSKEIQNTERQRDRESETQRQRDREAFQYKHSAHTHTHTAGRYALFCGADLGSLDLDDDGILGLNPHVRSLLVARHRKSHPWHVAKQQQPCVCVCLCVLVLVCALVWARETQVKRGTMAVSRGWLLLPMRSREGGKTEKQK